MNDPSFKMCASLDKKQHLILICICLITSEGVHIRNKVTGNLDFFLTCFSLIFASFLCYFFLLTCGFY